MHSIDWSQPSPCLAGANIGECPCRACAQTDQRVAAAVVRLVYEHRGVRACRDEAVNLALSRGPDVNTERRLAEYTTEMEMLDVAMARLTDLEPGVVWDLEESELRTFVSGLPNGDQTAPCVRVGLHDPTCRCPTHRQVESASLAVAVTRALELGRLARTTGATDQFLVSELSQSRTWLRTALSASAEEVAGLEALWECGLDVRQCWRAMQLVGGS